MEAMEGQSYLDQVRQRNGRRWMVQDLLGGVWDFGAAGKGCF